MLRRIVWAICIVVASAAAAPAQDPLLPAAPDTPPPAAAEVPPDTAMPPRDPTQVDPALQPLLGVGPAAVQPLMPPPVAIRGRAIGPAGKSVALLEIAGRLHIVRPNMRLSVAGTGGGVQTLVIKEISSRQVTFELGDTGRVFAAR